jgi:hypothetical protein
VCSTFLPARDQAGARGGGYLLWVFALVIQVYTIYVSAQAKLDASGTVEDAEEAQGFLA